MTNVICHFLVGVLELRCEERAVPTRDTLHRLAIDNKYEDGGKV